MSLDDVFGLPSKTAMTLKFLIDSRRKKVLFAEAGKDFVDFIFNLLALPLGTVIKLISAKSMVGSIGRLYESLEKLSKSYLQPNQNKSSLLQPKISSSASAPLLLVGVRAEPPGLRPSDFQYYICDRSYCGTHVTTTKGLKCPSLNNNMNTPVTFVPAASSPVNNASNYEKDSGGFVRGLVTYMVLDNLEVIPRSAISSVTLKNEFNMKNGGAQLEEKTVSVGMKEGLALLQTSFKSITVLTDVFLK